MHTKHVTLLNIFIPWFDYISFDMLFGERHLTYSSICVSDSCVCISLALSFLVQKTHRHTPNLLPVLSASPQPLYKRSLFKGPMKLARGYQWRQSTLMLLLHAEISTNRIEGKVETKRETRRRLWNLGRQIDSEVKSDEHYTNYKSV